MKRLVCSLNALGLLGSGCPGAPEGPVFTAPMTLGGQVVAAETLERGRRIYYRYCANCHGADGRADTPTARGLSPKPASFVTGRYKYSKQPAGQLPAHDDLANVVRRGVPGTAMPAWTVLTPDEVTAVTHYVKTFSERWRSPARHSSQLR